MEPLSPSRRVTLLPALALVILGALSGCGDDAPPEFCQHVADADASFPGDSKRHRTAYYRTLAIVAPSELRDDLNALRKMTAKPETFRRVGWDRHEGVVSAWLAGNCED